jgi:hypothetical protein
MGIVISVNGSAAGDGLLVAPDAGRTFSVPLSLSTDDGSTVSATINAAPNGAGVTLPGGAISIGPTATVISINATAVSNSRGDTVINVQVGAAKTTFSLTAITNPEIWFQGRFEVRFATDNDWYNDPKGTWGAGNDGTNPLGFGSQGPGYTFWLEGEPLFTPTGVDSLGVPLSVPTTIDKTGVGRVVRFNNPIAQRSHVAPIVTTVSGILGTLSGGGTTYFTAGDPVIGALVNVGPNTYLAQNWEPHSPPDPLPAESQAGGATFEPMALFECHIEGFFSGQPAIESPNPALDQRPRSTGYTGWVNDAASPISTTAGIPDFMTFSTTRQAALETDYGSLSAADQPTLAAGGAIVPGTGSAAGRNLVRRIQALSAVTGVAPSFGGTANRPGTDPQAWVSQEEYENGQVNDNITFLPNTSSVVAFLEGYTDFKYYNKLHTFHSDELCGFVYGSLQANSADRLAKTCIVQLQNSTFGKDQLKSIGLPATFPAAFWVVMDGFFPSELGIDATDNLTSPKNPPTVTFSVDPSNANQAAIINALQTMGQLTIEPFSGPVYTTTLPPAYAPQRILYPFTIQFTGTDGFIDETESLTLTATITVNGKTYNNSAPLVLTLAANPYVIDADGGNQYTTWLSTDLRTFTVDDDMTFFGKSVSDFYPPGAVAAQYPVTAAAASVAATAYIQYVIKQLTPSGAAGGDTFQSSLTEDEADPIDQLEYLQVNPRTHKAAFNFAICRVRIQGTTPPNPPPPFTTQAPNCRVFFRAFQAQNTVSTFDTSTTYRSTPIVVPDVTTRVPLLGVETDSMGQSEVVTIPFFAVDRVNLAAPTDLTTQPADAPNVQTISPTTGMEIDTYYGCWLDMNQPTPLFPQFVEASDFDNKTGYFNNTPMSPFQIQSINAAFTRAPHQCLIAEIAFDDVPIPPNADSSTSDKLAQRNLAYIDGPNPGVTGSRRMPHPFQIQASTTLTSTVDELMFSWGTTPAGSSASIYLPGVTAAEILALADNLYPYHALSAQDPYTITTPTGPVTFVPIPKSTGLLAGLLTVDLPLGIRDGDLYTVVVRQLTDAAQLVKGAGAANPQGARLAAAAGSAGKKVSRSRLNPSRILRWRRVLGAFQIDLRVSTKQNLLVPEERRLALFRWIAENVLPQSRWYPVMQRYISQLAGRVDGFGGNSGIIVASPSGNIPGQSSGGEKHHEHHKHHEEVSGKVSELLFDHFGDFEGFSLETRLGEFRRFRSRERRVLEIVRAALEARSWLTVIRELKKPDEVLSIIVRVPPPWHI